MKRTRSRLKKSNILLGITGSVAAYKSIDLIRRLRDHEASVTPVMTDASTRFITPMLVETAAGGRVYTGLWGDPLAHIELARGADALVVAPATANCIAKFAHGMADDLLSTCHLAFRGPVVLAPAMNTLMYEHAATRENLRTLRARGAVEVEPGCGPLACGDEGRGRMAPVEDILDEVEKALTPQDLAGSRIVVTAGPTREPLDPIRFLSNRSSGRMGYALARAAWLRGGEVTLISGPSALSSPRGARLVRVETASEMMQSVEAEAGSATAVIMAAAVADVRPSDASDGKIEKANLSTLALTPNPDILASLGSRSPRPFLIGFAAETGPGGIERARAKLSRKGADIIVFNDVSEPGSGFDTDTNRIVILGGDGSTEERPLTSKDDAAHAILDRLPRA